MNKDKYYAIYKDSSEYMVYGPDTIEEIVKQMQEEGENPDKFLFALANAFKKIKINYQLE